MNRILQWMKQSQAVHKKRIHRQGGFTLIELMLTLVIIGSILAFVFTMFHHTSSKEKVQQASTLIEELQSGIESLYSSNPNYTNLTTKIAIEAHAVSKANVVGGNIITPWYSNNTDSIITLAPAANTGQFTITLADIPSKACIGIGKTYINSDGAIVTANGTAVTSISSLASSCNGTNPATLAIT